MKALIVGPDRGLEAALRAEGAETVRIEGVATGERLDDAGIADADLLVITDAGEATAIPVAKERNPEVRAVAYTPDTLPEFVRGQVDLALEPGVLDAAVVAEELVAAQA